MTAPDAPGYLGLVFDLMAAEPIFHAWKRTLFGRSNAATDCGIPSVRQTPFGPHAAITIPEVHAARFARPCRRCFPKGWPGP